jgi:hypothetical protein
VVQRLDAPVAAHVIGEVGRGLGSGEAGDGVDRPGTPTPVVQGPGRHGWRLLFTDRHPMAAAPIVHSGYVRAQIAPKLW